MQRVSSRDLWCVLALALLWTSCTASDTPNESADGTPCSQAWDSAAETSDFGDTAETYRATFTDCATLDEWTRENIDHGEPLGNSATAVDNFCRNLGVTSSLCTEASGKVDAPLTPDGEAPPAARVESITCAEFIALDSAGERLLITDALLRRHTPKPDFNRNVSLDFGSAIEESCEPTNDPGGATPTARLIDVAASVYEANPGVYGGDSSLLGDN